MEPKFEDSRITLIHHAMNEFVVTQRKVQSHSLYPLLNHLVLLVQKPMLLVVFRRRVEQVDPECGSDTDWVHSFQNPLELKKKFDESISEHLRNVRRTKDKWVVDLPLVPRKSSNHVDNMYALGVFYLDLQYRSDDRQDDQRYRAAGRRLVNDAELRFLAADDLALIVRLFDSIKNHRSSEDKNDSPHLRHIAHYWCVARDSKSGSIFDRPKEGQSKDVTDVDSADIVRITKPIVDEIDRVYREARGQQPGIFPKEIPDDNGATILFTRHHHSLKKGLGNRPPTIAFFLQLRMPLLEAKNDCRRESGYRIVPVATEAICRDRAAVLRHHLELDGDPKDVLKYLQQLGIAEPQMRMLRSEDVLTEQIFEAMKIQSFLDRQFYHSMTYPVFSSGISMLVKAQACSRCDRMAYGADFMAEIGGYDTAFVSPLLISGFPFAAFVTKTNSDISQSGRKQDFDSFYHNYTFQMGLIGSWMARRIRTATENAYLKEISNTTAAGAVAAMTHAHAKHSFELNQDWFNSINCRLERVSQALPYTTVQVTSSLNIAEKSQRMNPSAVAFDAGHQSFKLFDHTLYFWFGRNNYYDRKVVDNDWAYVEPTKVHQAFVEGIAEAQARWDGLIEVTLLSKQRPH